MPSTACTWPNDLCSPSAATTEIPAWASDSAAGCLEGDVGGHARLELAVAVIDRQLDRKDSRAAALRRLHVARGELCLIGDMGDRTGEGLVGRVDVDPRGLTQADHAQAVLWHEDRDRQGRQIADHHQP